MRFGSHSLNYRSRKFRSGVTLIEMLVALVVVGILLACLFMILRQTQAVWKNVAVDNYAPANEAMNWVVQHLGEATVQPYWDYADAGGNFDLGAASFTPDHLALRSELYFCSGRASEVLPNFSTISTAVIYQSLQGSSQTYAHRGLNRLLNQKAYFVDYANETTVPGLIGTPRWRFRLKEVSLSVENSPGQQVTSSPKTTQATVLAENILALIVLPLRTLRDSQSASVVSYGYDSRQSNNGVGLNQLPPRLRVVMIALGESASTRLAAQYGTQMPIVLPKSLFQNADNFGNDLLQADQELTAQHLDHRIFERTVLLGNASGDAAP